MPALGRAVPLRGRPRHSRPLVAAHALALAALVALTVATAFYGSQQWFDGVYEAVLQGVVFVPPVVGGVVGAALGGEVFPTLALGATPSLAWAVAVVLGRGLATLLGRPLPTPDSPLWAIAGAFLIVGLAGAFGGFLAGRAGRLAWRWLAA